MSDTANSTVPSAGGDASEHDTAAQQKASDSQTDSHDESVQGSEVPSVTDTAKPPSQGTDKVTAGSAQGADSTEQTSEEQRNELLGAMDRAINLGSHPVPIHHYVKFLTGSFSIELDNDAQSYDITRYQLKPRRADPTHDTAAQQKASDSQTGSHNKSVQGSEVPSAPNTSDPPSEGGDEVTAGSVQGADSTGQTWDAKWTELHPEKSYSTEERAHSAQPVTDRLKKAGAEVTKDGGHGNPSKEQFDRAGLSKADSTDKTDPSYPH